MRLLLLGLVLLVAPAWCTPLPPDASRYFPIEFETKMTPVTDVNTPDWVRLTDLFAWWELTLGSVQDGNNPMTVVLRGGLRHGVNNVLSVVQWMEYLPILAGLNDPPNADGSGTPEPGTWMMVAGTLGGLWLRRRSSSG